MNDVDQSHRSEPVAIENAEGASSMCLQLLEHTRHALDICLPALDSVSFTGVAELEQLRRVAISGRCARIRLLLHDAAAAAKSQHGLLSLAQRMPSVLQIRTPTEETDRAYRATFVINDSGGHLFLPEATRAQGRACLLDRAAQAPLRQLFAQAWERSARAADWHRLDL